MTFAFAHFKQGLQIVEIVTSMMSFDCNLDSEHFYKGPFTLYDLWLWFFLSQLMGWPGFNASVDTVRLHPSPCTAH